MRTTIIAACVTILIAVATPLPAQSNEATEIVAWLRTFDQAFVEKNLDRLATFYHPEVTIFEGGSVNTGWTDYRDHHIGPELKQFEQLQFEHRRVAVHLLNATTAYVTSEYSVKARITDRDVDSSGLETLVLIKERDGTWKIRHAHSSARRRAPGPGAAGE